MSTLTTYRGTAARFLGRFHSGTFASSGNTALTGVDSSLVSSLSINDQFTDMYLFLPAKTSTDRESRLVTLYTPSSGTLTWDRAFSGSSVPNSAAYELHALIEPATEWTQILNDTLKRLMVVTEFTLTPTTNATRHDLTTANSWLINPTWVRQVGYLTSTETRANQSPYASGRWIRGFASAEEGKVYINHEHRTGATNETWYVRVLKPAYAHCKPTAGAFGDQAGLSLETDECELEAEFVAWAAIAMALEQNWIDFGMGADQQLEAKRQHAVLMASRYARDWENAHRVDTELRLTPLGPRFGPLPALTGWSR